MSGFMDKLTEHFEKLPGRLDRLKDTVQYAVNPDHRHDEADEQERDRIMTDICESHRFKSFADVTTGNQMKWFVSGHDYFWAVSEILEGAKECIFIADWWLTPELFLRRPPSENEEYRLDRLLLKKAQEGVQICIMIYKEVVQTMTMGSGHTKHRLEDLHQNIAVMRHPDHLGGEVTLMWSHHDKIVIVDNVVACVGGLDLCFGRWDTTTHPLSDVHPGDFSRTIFAGQDYNNARIKDFELVDRWLSNQSSRLDNPRMGWQDVHAMGTGPWVMDLAHLFVERWNFVKGLKYSKHRYPLLAFPHVVAENETPPPAIIRHPHYEKWAEIGRAFKRHAIPPTEDKGINPHGGLGAKGNMNVQVLRSSADWSSGILTEHSIQNAYLQMISEAAHCVYLENQFFITSTDGDGPVQNLIGKAITERVLSAARSGKKFKVVIVIPAVPGFAGDLKGNNGTLAIMDATYKSLCRGGNSIMEVIEREGFNPHDYVSVYNLRSYDRINNDPARLRAMSEKSGLGGYDAWAAMSRVFLGRDALPEELEKNSQVTFALGVEGGETIALDNKESRKAKNAPPTVTVQVPRDYDEAWERVHRFESGDQVREEISDSVAHHAQRGTGSLFDEAWSGDEESERAAYVTEELYVHSKLLIVDDRRVLLGSANLNERSQLGNRDSEVAVVIEDTDYIESRMNGAPYMAARFAATLRRQLWKNHLGLDEPQFCPPQPHVREPVTAAMQPVGVPHTDETQSEQDRLVMDPNSDETEALWKGTAKRNTEVFDEVFHCVPSAHVATWDEYKNYVPQAPIKPGHVATLDMPVDHIKRRLDEVRGHLVEMPLGFLARGYIPSQTFPHYEKWAEIGRAFKRHAIPPTEDKGINPHGGLGAKGNMNVQVLRSSADWSSGILTEHSIQNAYLQMISEANHCVFIENQFFITSTGGDGPVQNLIGKAITERVLSAARSGKKFKVVIVIPAVPGFAGDLKGNNGTLAIMDATYKSLCRGGNSIMEVIEREGFNPHDYVSVYNLRSYDRINNDPARLRAMAEKSGLGGYDAWAAMSRVFLGRDALPEELEKNSQVTFALGVEGGETIALDNKESRKAKNAPPTVTVQVPRDYDEAWERVHRFESRDQVCEEISDSVAHHAQRGTGSLFDEAWSGDEESERAAYVAEELYVHSKLLIVDDRRVLLGSANLNERSQLGNRDSEVAVVIEDTDYIESRMNGAPYMAARFAATLRRQLWKNHLGLDEPQFCPPQPHVREPVRLRCNPSEFLTPTRLNRSKIVSSWQVLRILQAIYVAMHDYWSSDP